MEGPFSREWYFWERVVRQSLQSNKFIVSHPPPIGNLRRIRKERNMQLRQDNGEKKLLEQLSLTQIYILKLKNICTHM